MNVRSTLRGIKGEQRKQVRALLRSGTWELLGCTRTGHLKLLHVPSGERLTVAGTGSEYRGNRNFAAQVRRIEEGRGR